MVHRVSSRGAQERAQTLSTEQMQVVMRHFLMAVITAIGDGAIAAKRYSQLGGDFRNGAVKGHDLCFRGTGREIFQRNIGAFGNQQVMLI